MAGHTKCEDVGDSAIAIPLANNQLGQNTTGTASGTSSSQEPGDDQSDSDHEEHDMDHGITGPPTEQLELDFLDTRQPEPDVKDSTQVQI